MNINRLSLFALAFAVPVLLLWGLTTAVVAASNDITTTNNSASVGVAMFCVDVTVTNQTELEAALIDYNANCGNGDTKTVTVNGTIILASALSIINNTTTAVMTITGGTVDGADSYRLFNINNGNINFASMTLQNGHATDGDDGVPSAADEGGAIRIFSGNITVTNSVITGNIAARLGGGINMQAQASTTVENSTFFNNTATEGGGAINNGNGNLNINNSTFSENLVLTTYGGAIQLNGPTGIANISNSTFSGNRSPYAGAIVSAGGSTLTITNSTLSGNQASTLGGAILMWNSTLNLNNTILANSTTDGSTPTDDCRTFGANTITFSSGQSNLIERGTSCGTPGTDFIQADPLLGALADNGGSTLTHMPRIDSPAVDAGDCASASLTDQRGLTRPQNATCDIGAVEVQSGEDDIQVCSLVEGGVYHFGATGVQIEIDTLGGLNCLEIGIINALHISATGTITAGIQAPYVTITPTLDNLNTYTVTMTLLHPGFSNPLICKNPGDMGGAGWDCIRDDFDSNRVWRGGINGFSDWAVGNDVNPTAVTNLQANTTSGTSSWWLVGLLVGLLGVGTAVFLRRRSARRSTFPKS